MIIVRLTRDEFELSDGRIFPVIPPLMEDMTIEEFQKHYDYASQVVGGCRDVGCDNSDITDLGQSREDKDGQD